MQSDVSHQLPAGAGHPQSDSTDAVSVPMAVDALHELPSVKLQPPAAAPMHAPAPSLPLSFGSAAPAPAYDHASHPAVPNDRQLARCYRKYLHAARSTAGAAADSDSDGGGVADAMSSEREDLSQLRLLCLYMLHVASPELSMETHQQGLVLLDYSTLLSYAPQLQLSNLAERLHRSEASRVRMLSLLSVAATASLQYVGAKVDPSVSRVRVQLLDEFDIERAWEARKERRMELDSPQSEQVRAATQAAAKERLATEVAADPMQIDSGATNVRRTTTGHRVAGPSGSTHPADSSERTRALEQIAMGRGLLESLVLPQPDELDAIMMHIKLLMQHERRETFIKQAELRSPDGMRIDMIVLEEELHGCITGWRGFIKSHNRDAIAILSAVVAKIYEEEVAQEDEVELHSRPRLPLGLPCPVRMVHMPSKSSLRSCVEEGLQSKIGHCITMRGIVTQVQPATLGRLNQLVCLNSSQCNRAIHRQLAVFGDHPICSRCNDVTVSARGASVADTLVERQKLIVSEPPPLRLNDPGSATPIHAEVHLSGSQQVRRFAVGDAVELVGILQCYSPQNGQQQVYVDCQYAYNKSLNQVPISGQFVREIRAHQSAEALALLVSSLAPNVLGYDVAKLCLLLSLVSGVDAAQSNPNRGCAFARDAINVCLTGTHKEAIKSLLESVTKVSTNGSLLRMGGATSRYVREAVRISAPGSKGEVATTSNTPLANLHGGLLSVQVDEDAADWRLPFRTHPALLQSMESTRLGVMSAASLPQRAAVQLRSSTTIIMGGPPAKKFKDNYDAGLSMSDNLSLPASHLSHFDARLLLHEDLMPEQVEAYVEQFSPLLTPLPSSGSGAASPMPMSSPRASPRPSPRSLAAHTSRTNELKRKLAGDPTVPLEAMPPGILARYLCYASQQPAPIFSKAIMHELFAAFHAAAETSSERGVDRWTAPVCDSVVRLAVAMARLQLAKQVMPEHVQDAMGVIEASCMDLDPYAGATDMRKPGAGRGSSARELREMFLKRMLDHCSSSDSWTHSLETCWEVARGCGVQLEARDFKTDVLMPLMSERDQRIMQGPNSTYKFNRNL